MTYRNVITKLFTAAGVGALLLPLGTARAADADDQRAPGGGRAMTVGATETATVKAVDPAKRTVTLQTPDGATATVKCGKNVINFDQVKVGDQVRAMAVGRIAVYVGKDAPPSDREGGLVALAPKGEKPGVIVVKTEQVTDKVDAVDAAGHTVTLSPADGGPVTIDVAPSIDLSGVKKGDDITVLYTEGVALLVERPQEGDAAQPAGAVVKPKADGQDVGAAGVETATATATVTAVDPDKRLVTLANAAGDKKTIHLGKEAINFDQIKVGDKVRATVAEAVAVSVSKAGAAPGEGAGAAIALAPKGSKPGMIIASSEEVTGQIQSIDTDARTVTLAEADGPPRTIKAGPKVDLSALSKGDDVTARCTAALAIIVEKP